MVFEASLFQLYSPSSPSGPKKQPKLLVVSEGYYHYLSCEQWLEGNVREQNEGQSVTAEGGCGRDNLWDIFLWPQFIAFYHYKHSCDRRAWWPVVDVSAVACWRCGKCCYMAHGAMVSVQFYDTKVCVVLPWCHVLKDLNLELCTCLVEKHWSEVGIWRGHWFVWGCCHAEPDLTRICSGCLRWHWIILLYMAVMSLQVPYKGDSFE
jgi:hypothetical protein